VKPNQGTAVRSISEALVKASLSFRRVRKITKSDYELCHVCISIYLSVLHSFRMEYLDSNRTDFHKSQYLNTFRKYVESFIKTWQEQQMLYMTANIQFWLYLTQFLEWKMFKTSVVDKIKTQVLYSITFFENRTAYEIIRKKYCVAGQATDGNMTQTHCQLDT